MSWSLLHLNIKTHEEVVAFSFLRNGTRSVVSIRKTYKNKWTTGYTYKIHSKNESFCNINICNRAEWFKIWNNILKYLFSCLPLDVLSTLSSSLTVFVLEHPPRGNSGIFSLNSFPFRPFQHLQLVTDEWGALSCSCSLVVVFFFMFSHFLFFFSVSSLFSLSIRLFSLSLFVTYTSLCCLSAKFFQQKYTGGNRRFFFCARRSSIDVLKLLLVVVFFSI